MPTRYLLDTGVAGVYLKNDLVLRRRLKGNIFYIAAVVAGELYHGAFHSNDRTTNLQTLQAALAPWHGRMFLCDESTAQHFGRIAADLQSRGLKIPHNDIWLAALAIQYSLILLTGDPKHMAMIDGLVWERWG